MSPVKPEDDFDDLDEVLEEFNKPVLPPQSLSTSVPSTSSDTQLVEDEETKAFREALEKMLLESFQGLSSDKDMNMDEMKAAKEMRDNWEKMIIEDLEAGERGNSLPTSSGPSGSTKSQSTSKEKSNIDSASDEDPFQKAIRQAMDKLKSSDDALKADSQNLSQDDTLDNLLSSLRDLNLEGEDGEGLESMLENMMSQLMSKEILYDPLKELDTKYPEYLAKHRSSLPKEDLDRYTAQSAKVSEIVAIFERSTYSDDDATQVNEILKLMNEMQSYGSPPAEIMGAMPPGLEFGSDGLPKLPEGCILM